MEYTSDRLFQVLATLLDGCHCPEPDLELSADLLQVSLRRQAEKVLRTQNEQADHR